jgi:hypothetical protein
MNPPVVVPFTDSRVRASVAARGLSRLVSPRSVRSQLSNIVKSDGFTRAERMKRFLEFVVEETLAGRANQLCEYNIGTSVFGRDSSFEPALDPIVRNDARRLRQKLLEYYQQIRNEDPVIIEVPKGGYVPVFRWALQPETPNARQQYRLTARLTRADGSAVWTTDEDLQIDESSEQLCFALRLQLRTQEPHVSTLPLHNLQTNHTDKRTGRKRVIPG